MSCGAVGFDGRGGRGPGGGVVERFGRRALRKKSERTG